MAAIKLEPASAKIALIDLAVIADGADHVIGPAIAQSKPSPRRAGLAQEALQPWIRARVIRLLDVVLGQAELLGLDEREHHPPHQRRPLQIVRPHDRAMRFLRDQVGQQLEIVAVRRRREVRGQAHHVIADRIAAPGEERRQQGGTRLEPNGLHMDAGFGGVIDHIAIDLRPLGRADRGAIQIGRTLGMGALIHQKSLPRIHRCHGDRQAKGRIPHQRQRRGAFPYIDLSRLDRGEADHRGQRDELHLIRVAEQGGGDGAADLRMEPDHAALAIDHGIAGRVLGDAADQHPAGFDRVQQRARFGRTRQDANGRERHRRQTQAKPREILHESLFLEPATVGISPAGRAGPSTICAPRRP